MIIGLLQLNSTIGDFAANREKLLAAYAQAVARGAEFVIAPELFLCGYPPRDLLQREDFVAANLATLGEVASRVGHVPLCLGYVERSRERPGRALKNAAAVVQDAEAYQRLLDIAARADADEGIRQGLADVKQGNVRPAREFFAEFEAEHGIRR